MEINIDEIFKAYDEDPKAAERRFRGKTLKISGGFATNLSQTDLTLMSRTWQIPRQYDGPNYVIYSFGPDRYNFVLEASKKMARGESVTITCQLGEKPGLKGYLDDKLDTCSFRR